ncbi:MAG: putative O-glycosylation ligase, exosortase A system-associated [Pseudomonadota bacterium]
MITSIFIVFALACMLPAILMVPHTAMFVWCWVSYMNPHRNTWSFAATLPLLDVVAGFTFVAWLTSKERKLPPLHPIGVVMFVFFLWTCITTLFAVNDEAAAVEISRFSKVILFTFFTMIFITTERRIKYFIYVILLSLTLYSFKGGLFTILNGGRYIVYGPPQSFLADNNQLALAFLTVCPLFYWVFKHGENKVVRLSAAIAGCLTLIAAIGSQSRGALVALVAMCGWILFISRRFMLGLVVGGAVIGGALLFMPDSWQERMSTISNYEEDTSASTRLKMWRYSMNVANSSPVIGGGFRFFFDKDLAKQYMPSNDRIFVAHSIYFDTLGEHGYVGLFLYLLLLSCGFITTMDTRRMTKGHEDFAWAHDLAQMLQFSLVGFGVGGAFLSLATFDLYYHVLALSMMVNYVVGKQLSPDREVFALPGQSKQRRSEGAALPAE